MSKIFKNSEEKYMANYELFASSAKPYTFKDETMTVKATKDEVVAMFKHGVIVNYEGVLCTPIACGGSENTAVLMMYFGEDDAPFVEIESAANADDIYDGETLE